MTEFLASFLSFYASGTSYRAVNILYLFVPTNLSKSRTPSWPNSRIV